MDLLGLSVLITVAAGPAAPPQLSCTALPSLLDSMRAGHYDSARVSKVVEERAVDQYLKMLDPSKALLLESDVKRLRGELPAVFTTMRRGVCDLLEKAASLVRQRAEDDVKAVRALLGDRYKLDENVELILDPDDRGYAKTEAQRAALVRSMVHFQISNQLQTGAKLAVARERVAHRYELVARRLNERRVPERLPGVYAQAYASGMDPHSSFLDAETLADFQIAMKLSLEGIGAVLRSEYGYTVVESIVPGGQADKEGSLRPKDKIIAVAQKNEQPVSTIDMDLRDVVRMIRGKKGTQVTLSVLREKPETRTLEITIVRDKIDVKERAAKIEYETRKRNGKSYNIGVLELPSFYGGEGGRSSYEDTKRLLEEANAKKVDGLVLDLSENGGGLLGEGVKIAGLFLKLGNVVATRSSGGRLDVLADEDPAVVYRGPLVVLISPVSASASEIVAGALRDYGRAVIAGGEHTFGKGTVQQLNGLPAGLGAVKLTMGMFFLPSGVSTQQNGVRSHIRIPSLLDGYSIAEKELDYSLPPGATPAFQSDDANGQKQTEHWTPVTKAQIKRLGSLSGPRVAKQPVLQEILKDLAEDKKDDKKPVKLSTLREKNKGDEGKDDDDYKAEQEKKKKAFVGEGVDIAADLVSL